MRKKADSCNAAVNLSHSKIYKSRGLSNNREKSIVPKTQSITCERRTNSTKRTADLKMGFDLIPAKNCLTYDGIFWNA